MTVWLALLTGGVNYIKLRDVVQALAYGGAV